jgi:hypothetical protein
MCILSKGFSNKFWPWQYSRNKELTDDGNAVTIRCVDTTPSLEKVSMTTDKRKLPLQVDSGGLDRNSRIVTENSQTLRTTHLVYTPLLEDYSLTRDKCKLPRQVHSDRLDSGSRLAIENSRTQLRNVGDRKKESLGEPGRSAVRTLKPRLLAIQTVLFYYLN